MGRGFKRTGCGFASRSFGRHRAHHLGDAGQEQRLRCASTSSAGGRRGQAYDVVRQTVLDEGRGSARGVEQRHERVQQVRGAVPRQLGFHGGRDGDFGVVVEVFDVQLELVEQGRGLLADSAVVGFLWEDVIEAEVAGGRGVLLLVCCAPGQNHRLFVGRVV